ncbi:TonB-dependent receptor [Flavobacteriaceae bacterium]|nr:TonB-dependent receptor [Flavobacteriaceae bacterium]
MRNTKFIPVVVIFCLTLISHRSRAQSESCTNAIEIAQNQYNIGSFTPLKSLLVNCLLKDKKATNTRKNLARELMALTAIAEDSLDVAGSYIKQMVLADSGFEPVAGKRNFVFKQLYEMIYDENVGITVSSVSKRPEDIKTAPATVELISAKDIEARGYMDIVDLLSDVAGFEISKIHSVLYANIFQLGFRQENTERTLLMVDGVEENDLWLNWAYLSRQYPISNIKAVEIVYGPSSTMYGPRAFVGAINIITYAASEMAGDFFDDREKNKKGVYAHGTLSSGSFGTKDADFTFGNTNGRFNFQITGRYFYSEEHDMSSAPFYNYDAADLNKFEYNHLNKNFDSNDALQSYLTSNNLGQTSPYYNISNNSILLTDAGAALALQRDQNAYSGIVNGNPISYSNHSEDYFIGAKVSFDKFLFGIRTWKRTEGFNFYQDVDVAPSKSGSVWSPENTTLYFNYNETFNDYLSFSLLSTFKNHRLGQESNRVNFRPFGDPTTSLSISQLVNEDTATSHGWRNRFYFYQALQGRSEGRLYYNSNNLNLLFGTDYRITSTQGDYLVKMDYNTLHATASDYSEYLETPYAQQQGTVSGQDEGSNMFLVQDIGTYLQGSYIIADKFYINAGIRYDINKVRVNQGYEVFTPRLGLTYSQNNITLKTNYSRGFQNVSLYTKYSTGGGRTPNPDINPEEIDYIDFSFLGNNSKKSFEWNFTGFAYVVNNAVASVVKDGKIYNDNDGSYRVLGSMLNLKYKVSNFNLYANATYFNPFKGTFDFGDIISATPEADKTRLGDIANYRFNTGFYRQYKIKNLNLGINGRLNWVNKKQVGPQTTQDLNLGINQTNEIPSYYILNGNFILGHSKFPMAKVSVAWNNILNKFYYHPGPRTAAGYFDLEAQRSPTDSYATWMKASLWNKNTPYIPQRPSYFIVKLILDL